VHKKTQLRKFLSHKHTITLNYQVHANLRIKCTKLSLAQFLANNFGKVVKFVLKVNSFTTCDGRYSFFVHSEIPTLTLLVGWLTGRVSSLKKICCSNLRRFCLGDPA